jgi:hypothetical protein
MELKEINVPEGIVRQIDHEGQFAGIAVDAGNGNNICSNFNFDMLYEETLVDIKKIMGSVPVSMTSLSKKVLIRNWSSQKMAEEINMERMRYLLSTDKILEEWHSCTERK